jgi:hypothetical protein
MHAGTSAGTWCPTSCCCHIRYGKASLCQALSSQKVVGRARARPPRGQAHQNSQTPNTSNDEKNRPLAAAAANDLAPDIVSADLEAARDCQWVNRRL